MIERAATPKLPVKSGGRTSPRRLRSLAFDAAWIGWTLLLAAAIPFLWAAGTPPVHVRRVTRLWSRGTLGLLSRIVGLKCLVTGTGNVPAEPCLIVCNHQSTWETVAALHLFSDVAIVAKRELLAIPILGWYLKRSPMIIIDREAGPDAIRGMIKQARAAVGDGRSILIFPEGTRTPAGVPVRFRRGVEQLVRRLAIPLLPVAVDSGRYWRQGQPKRAGAVTVSILSPIRSSLAPADTIRKAETAVDQERERIGG